MKLAQLQATLRAKTLAYKTLLENTMRTAQAAVVKPATATEPEVTGRAMTTEERAALEASLKECTDLEAQIDGMKGDARFAEELNRITGGLATAPTPTPAPAGGARAAAGPSIGQQFANHPAYREWIRNGGHSRAGGVSPDLGEFSATTLDTSSGSGGPLILPDYQPGFVPLLFPRLVVADLIAAGTTLGNLISYIKQSSFTNNAKAVKEGTTKPESAMAFAPATSPVQKLAHWIPVTEEMLEDFNQTQSIIDAQLRLGLSQAEETQLLFGNGVAPNLLGLMNLVGIAAAQARGADSNIDAIFKQITNISVNALVTPDGIVLNPFNWMTIQLQKNAQGAYMGTGPFAAAQTQYLWGLPVANTPAMAQGTGLVGAFKSCAQVFRKGGVRVEASNSHMDFFIKNMVAIRCEERLALASYRDAGFGQVTGLV